MQAGGISSTGLLWTSTDLSKAAASTLKPNDLNVVRPVKADASDQTKPGGSFVTAA